MRREIHSNPRLIVTPSSAAMYLRNNPASIRSLLDAMANDIRRHVDHVGAVKVEWDAKAECSHCGYEWETLTAEDLADGMAANPADYEHAVVGEPVCCNKALAEFCTEQSQTGGES